jgi:hypothetical protein
VTEPGTATAAPKMEDDKGDDERIAFAFDRSRLEVDGLA